MHETRSMKNRAAMTEKKNCTHGHLRYLRSGTLRFPLEDATAAGFMANNQRMPARRADTWVANIFPCSCPIYFCCFYTYDLCPSVFARSSSLANRGLGALGHKYNACEVKTILYVLGSLGRRTRRIPYVWSPKEGPQSRFRLCANPG